MLTKSEYAESAQSFFSQSSQCAISNILAKSLGERRFITIAGSPLGSPPICETLAINALQNALAISRSSGAGHETIPVDRQLTIGLFRRPELKQCPSFDTRPPGRALV
jgi:hypothetical protein